MTDVRTYPPADRPSVTVLIDGTWYVGELRQWVRREDGWWGNVAYSRAPGETLLGTFHEDDIRRDET